MLGRIDPNRRDVTIIGAGVSGLLLAYRLDSLGYRVRLFEGSERAGGLIETRRTELGLAESAAHSFLVSAEVRTVCADLGVELIDAEPDEGGRVGACFTFTLPLNSPDAAEPSNERAEGEAASEPVAESREEPPMLAVEKT